MACKLHIIICICKDIISTVTTITYEIKISKYSLRVFHMLKIVLIAKDKGFKDREHLLLW